MLDGVSDWVIHELRRTMRTRLSALPVQDLVRELVIAHAKPGLHKVYDQHAYQNEKRQCLELWEARLLSIVEPRPGDFTDLAEAREFRATEVYSSSARLGELPDARNQPGLPSQGSAGARAGGALKLGRFRSSTRGG